MRWKDYLEETRNEYERLLYRNRSDRKVAEKCFSEYIRLTPEYPDDPDFRDPKFSSKDFAFIVGQYELKGYALQFLADNWDSRGISGEVAELRLSANAALDNIKEALYDEGAQRALERRDETTCSLFSDVFKDSSWTDACLRYCALDEQELDISDLFVADVERSFLEIINEKRKELKLTPLKEDVLCLQNEN